MTAKQCDLSLPSGWVNLNVVRYLLTKNEVTRAPGIYENSVDGRVHWICTHTSGTEFILNANYYDGKTFQPLLDWIDQLPKLDTNDA